MADDGIAWFSLNRTAKEGVYRLDEVAFGLLESPVLGRVFPSEEDRAQVRELHVEVAVGPGYAYVDDTDGTLVISQDYLQTGDKLSLYLDLVHELIHVRQFREGKELYDRRFAYVDRPTEIEAYKVAVEEGRRLGMTDAELVDYLRIEWVTDEELGRLARACGVPYEA
jgi:hypothetical protein